MVSGDMVLTPPLSSSILAGITRDSVIQICNELGIPVKERSIQRAALYVADELFFSGTAAEITPIRSVDRISVGSGERGPVTTKIQTAFFEITKGERPAPGKWLTYVNAQKQVQSASDSLNRSSATRNEPSDDDSQAILVYHTASGD
jgi:branched-chain amino acid aminotransferase